MSSSGPALHDAVRPLEWLLGKWESVKAEGFYPTIKPFDYKESLVFSHIGQPMLNFSFSSHDPNNKPMHNESGFLRVNVGTNKVAFLSAQNIGVVEIEEGEVNGTELCLDSTSVSSVSFGKEPKTTKIARTFKLIDENTLEQNVAMATSRTPELLPHLKVQYKKKVE
ncbi:peroxynitrite isomerase THAP4-like [Diadema antillarum]|uniref:peroxynitrite isomerase THAP4-like n=1 Tax=Diadema antillarum TaxID=105358 RepID=UPI003A83A947